MQVPGVAASAVIDLHEAHAGFRQTARRQTDLTEKLCNFLDMYGYRIGDSS
jgi:hypothetical protein